MKAITFNKNNECQKQDGFEPSAILYSGKIENITDENLVNWGIGYLELAELLKQANGEENEDSVMIVTSQKP